MSKQIIAGGVAIGGGAPVTIQSMCNTHTEDAKATIAQIHALEEAGCEIVRVTVPNMEAAHALSEIKENISIPLVADIHFDYRLAVEAAAPRLRRWMPVRTKFASTPATSGEMTASRRS